METMAKALSGLFVIKKKNLKWKQTWKLASKGIDCLSRYLKSQFY